MKKKYIKPKLNSEEFVPQEYIAACGDINKVYKFICDAPTGVAWMESNNRSGLQKGLGLGILSDTKLGGYRPCGEPHEAQTTDDFRKGYLDPYSGGKIIDVIIWRGVNNDNVHCTTALDMNEWETAKS